MELLARFLGLPRIAAGAAFRAALFHVVFVASVTIIKSGTNALFLSRADPRHLPLLYAVVAVVVAVATSVLARLLARRPIRRVLPAAFVIAATAIVIGATGVFFGIRGAPGTLYVLGEATATSGSVLFWARVMDAFHARDQRKVIGIIGGGGMLGAAVGGLFVKFTVGFTGVIVPTAAAALLWIVALPLLRPLRARTPAHEAAQSSLLPALRYLAGAGYPRAVAGLVVLLAATGAATDFVFRSAAATAETEAGMAALFGLLNAVVGAIVVVFQVGLTSRLLERLGVFAFAALVPITLVIMAAVHGLIGAGLLGSSVSSEGRLSFWLLIGMKGVEMAGAYSLNQAAVALLYNPMPNEMRAQARPLIDGAIKKAGAAGAGLTLGALAAADVRLDSGAVAVVALLTLALLPLLRRRYLDALQHKLQGPGARRSETRIDPRDKDTRHALENALTSPDADDVVNALDTLGADWQPSRELLLHLLEHSDDRVRAAALARVPTSPDPRLADRLLQIASSSGARRPRAEAVRALARAMPGRAAGEVAAFLHDDDPGVVAAALEVGLRQGAHPAARQRLEQLVGALGAQPPAWRREIARLLGALGETRYNAVLARLIDDEDASVRQLAIEAAGREQDPEHLPRLISHLSDQKARVATTKALVRFGDRAVPLLSSVLNDVHASVSVRLHVPRVLARIRSATAARALLFSNPRDDAWLQTRISAALGDIVKSGAVDPDDIDRKRTSEAIGRRLVAFEAYDDAWADLQAGAEPGLQLLTRAVADRRRQNLGIAFDLLGLHHGQERMERVVAGLQTGGDAARHDALELLDAALAGDPLRDDFLALLDVRRPVRVPALARGRAVQLAGSRDPLLRGVARATVRRLGMALPVGAAVDRRVAPGARELEGADMADELVERMFVLEDVDLFSGLPADDLLAIAAIASELTVEAASYLYREGETGTQLYVIVEGVVELTRAGHQVMTLQAGASAGQVSFLDRGPRPVTARVAARGPARLLVVEREAFLELMAERTGLMHAFFGVLAARLRVLIEGQRQS